jgi:hypothetical protein
MDEATGKKTAEFPQTRAVLRSVLLALIDEHAQAADQARTTAGGGGDPL